MQCHRKLRTWRGQPTSNTVEMENTLFNKTGSHRPHANSDKYLKIWLF